jgi:hypothetical protein
MPAADYRRMATLSFEGTLTAKAKTGMIAIKAIKDHN